MHGACSRAAAAMRFHVMGRQVPSSRASRLSSFFFSGFENVDLIPLRRANSVAKHSTRLNRIPDRSNTTPASLCDSQILSPCRNGPAPCPAPPSSRWRPRRCSRPARLPSFTSSKSLRRMYVYPPGQLTPSDRFSTVETEHSETNRHNRPCTRA